MKRSWTALAVALVTIFGVAGCNDYGNTFQNNTGASISFLSPSQISAGSGDFTLTVNGSGFVAKTVVQWNGNSLKTTSTLDSAGNILNETAAVPSALVAKPGVAIIITVNPASGAGNNGLSNPIAFFINPPSSPLPGTTAGAAATALVAEETPALSLDGRYVAYAAAQNERAQVFLRDTCEGAAAGCQPRTTLLSTATDGSAANEESHTPSMSADGRYVAFSSAATNLVEDAPPGRQIYLRDTCAGAGESCKPSTQLISTDANGALVGTESILPSVSSSGRFVAFLASTPSHSSNQLSAQSKNPASGSNSGYRQVFIRDTCLGVMNCTPKTTRISLQPGDETASASKPAGPALSGDARHVAISGADAATLFTRSVAVDDRVFLAIASQQP